MKFPPQGKCATLLVGITQVQHPFHFSTSSLTNNNIIPNNNLKTFAYPLTLIGPGTNLILEGRNRRNNIEQFDISLPKTPQAFSASIS
jgi:hypothetical protein